LNKLKYEIDDAYAKERITEQHYDLLNKKISENKR